MGRASHRRRALLLGSPTSCPAGAGGVPLGSRVHSCVHATGRPNGRGRLRAPGEILRTDRRAGLRFMSVVTIEDRFATAGLPLLLTVEEAAAVLRIGRTLAYSLAHRYEKTGGVTGLPVIRLGNCLRVPRWALIELACTGLVVALSELDAHTAELLSRLDDEPPSDLLGELHQRREVEQRVELKPQEPKRTAGRAAAARVGQQLVLLPLA